MACTNVTFNGLANDCESSLGGVKMIWLAPWAASAYTLSTDTTGATANKVSIDTGVTSTFKPYILRKGSASMTSTLNVDAANGTNYVSTVVSMAFTKMETRKRVEIQAMALGDMLCVVLDSNGKYWALGKDEPLTATAGTGVTGQAKGDANQYTVEITDESQVFPYEIVDGSGLPTNITN